MTGCGAVAALLHPSRLFVTTEDIERGHCSISDFALSVSEAKDFKDSSKASFFCDVELNDILFARTSMKQLCGDSVFWGEQFKFRNLPSVRSATIKLYRGINHRKKVKAQHVGTISLPITQVTCGKQDEKWYRLESCSRHMHNASLRIQTSYQTFTVLPLQLYSSLLEYLTNEYTVLCATLDPVLTSKVKDELAQTLVNIFASQGKPIQFLADILMMELAGIDSDDLILRANTFASKSIDHFMKNSAKQYLSATLEGAIRTVIESTLDCEVDPNRLQRNADLVSNQANLLQLVGRIWGDICASISTFPSELQDLFAEIREKIGQRKLIWQRVVSGTLFLRFFCPAILSPNLFQLWKESPSEAASRKLTLVAKTLQNLANFTRFGVKESYMVFMNDYVDRELPKMENFLAKVSAHRDHEQATSVVADEDQTDANPWHESPCITPPSTSPVRANVGQRILVQRPPASPPLSRDLAIFHQILQATLAKLDEASLKRLEVLQQILLGLQRELDKADFFDSQPSVSTGNQRVFTLLPTAEEPDDDEHMKDKLLVSPHFPTTLVQGDVHCFAHNPNVKTASTGNLPRALLEVDCGYHRALSVSKSWSGQSTLSIEVIPTVFEEDNDATMTLSEAAVADQKMKRIQSDMAMYSSQRLDIRSGCTAGRLSAPPQNTLENRLVNSCSTSDLADGGVNSARRKPFSNFRFRVSLQLKKKSSPH